MVAASVAVGLSGAGLLVDGGRGDVGRGLATHPGLVPDLSFAEACKHLYEAAFTWVTLEYAPSILHPKMGEAWGLEEL